MPKLNLGKVVGDKGDSFVFEDFTPEQLDGLTPKMLKGNVTTLDPDQNATVDIRKDGLNNYIDFGIPRGKNGSEIKSISAENVEMANGNTLENAMTAANESISGIEEPAFDDTTSTYTTLAESNTAAETTSNAIQSHTSIFSTLSNMKKSLSAIVQGLKILGTNVGGIHGISSALDSQREDIAASSKAVSVLNSNLKEIIITLSSTITVDIVEGYSLVELNKPNTPSGYKLLGCMGATHSTTGNVVINAVANNGKLRVYNNTSTTGKAITFTGTWLLYKISK